MKRIVAIVCFMCVVGYAYSQNREAKWTLSVGASLVNFGDSGPNSIGERFLVQIPKLSLSRYLFSGLSLDFSTTISIVNSIDGFYTNDFNYFSLDGSIRYDFGTSTENLVPYIGFGMGIIKGPETIAESKNTPTTNYVFGGAFWFTPRFGLQVEAVYKFSRKEFESMKSHTQLSAGFIYSFKPRNMVQRLWNKRR